ncbi:dihydrofolate reductase [mine drainage metagenome]|uniref:dihydrofolate reductase n=1 Tax=mine drainage metagenome TaxID=410659 RepID=A0A1J5RQ54_9ZZZZ
MRTRVAIIVAVGPNRTIGQDNQMPWKLPKDMKLFRRVTTGHTVIMGRKTFESLGRKPLPKRRNIVVTRNADYRAPGCEVVHSLDEAIQLGKGEQRLFVIGGGELYRAALPIADEVYLTEIADRNPTADMFSFPGDTFFPHLDENEWTLARKRSRWFIASDRLPALREYRLKRTGLYFRMLKYIKRRRLTCGKAEARDG